MMISGLMKRVMMMVVLYDVRDENVQSNDY